MRSNCAVEAGLRSGVSWQAIADALGVTRQAVHKKHAKRIAPTIGPDTGGQILRGTGIGLDAICYPE